MINSLDMDFNNHFRITNWVWRQEDGEIRENLNAHIANIMEDKINTYHVVDNPVCFPLVH